MLTQRQKFGAARQTPETLRRTPFKRRQRRVVTQPADGVPDRASKYSLRPPVWKRGATRGRAKNRAGATISRPLSAHGDEDMGADERSRSDQENDETHDAP